MRVPVSNTLGPIGAGMSVILSNFNHERWMVCATSISAQRLVVEECLKYVLVSIFTEEVLTLTSFVDQVVNTAHCVWKTLDKPSCYTSKISSYDFSSRSMPELVREHYSSDEQGTYWYGVFSAFIPPPFLRLNWPYPR